MKIVFDHQEKSILFYVPQQFGTLKLPDEEKTFFSFDEIDKSLLNLVSSDELDNIIYFFIDIEE